MTKINKNWSLAGWRDLYQDSDASLVAVPMLKATNTKLRAAGNSVSTVSAEIAIGCKHTTLWSPAQDKHEEKS